MATPESAARMCWAKIERLLWFGQAGPPEESCQRIMVLIQSAIEDCLAEDPPWPDILTRLELVVAQGKGIRRQALTDVARGRCAECRKTDAELPAQLMVGEWVHLVDGKIRPCQAPVVNALLAKEGTPDA